MDKNDFIKMMHDVGLELLSSAYDGMKASDEAFKRFPKRISEETFRTMLRDKLATIARYYGIIELLDEIDNNNIDSYLDTSFSDVIEIIPDDEGS